MENASKALIIAGAILLAILIISLGLIIYQKAAGTINGVNLTEQEKQTFNAKFAAYEGNNVSGTQVNALIQQVITSNTSSIRDNTGTYIGMYFPTASDSTGNTYLTIQVYKGTASDELSYTKSTSKPSTFTKDSNTIATKGVATELKKVSTGKTYKVEFLSNDGIVSAIKVESN